MIGWAGSGWQAGAIVAEVLDRPLRAR